MARSRRARRDQAIAVIGLAGGAVVAGRVVAHFWGWLAVSAVVAGGAYVAGRRGRRPVVVQEARRAASPKRSVVRSVSAVCAGGDHELCAYTRCTCRCGHGTLRGPAGSADDPVPF